MKKLKVDIEEIAEAMESSFGGNYHSYLDRETGKVILIEDEGLEAVEGRDLDLIAGFPDWQKDSVDEAELVIDVHDRFLSIPALESHKGLKQMVDFTRTVEDESLREKLSIALDGKGALGLFKKVLELYPPQRERWFAFKRDRMAEEVVDFLFAADIRPIEKSK